MLLKCFPPLTFHVATAILSLELNVNSSFLLHIASNRGEGTAKFRKNIKAAYIYMKNIYIPQIIILWLTEQSKKQEQTKLEKYIAFIYSKRW